ncbi:uncharacterized protein [Maniola hyperantus]|uniref:uncharacterized protein n=1 Tax=Aphantopus hyperantus TaxID=2795564 RepID=UPI003748EE93
MIYAHYAHSRIDGMDLSFETSIRFSLIFNFVFYCSDCILLFFSNIYSSKYEIQLVVRVQKIINNFRFISNNFKNWKKENWIYVAGIYFIYLLVAVMFIILFHYEVNISVARFAYVFLLLYYDVNMICAFRYIKLCQDCLGWWISNLRYYSRRFQKYDNDIGKMNSKYYLKGFLDAYLDILNSFDMIKNIFQLPILLQIIDGFAHGLIYSQIFIEIGKVNFLESASSTTSIIAESFVFGWIVKNILVLSLCIKGCEEFYTTIAEAERNCVMNLGSNAHPELKKLYKNVMRTNRSKFTKMSACGVLTIDATLPLRFFEQWAVYVTVLLQFAFH